MSTNIGAAELAAGGHARAVDDGNVSSRYLVPVARVAFAATKTLGRPSGTALGQPVRGYEIHHGVVDVEGGEAFLDGCRAGSVWGTSWHGILETDDFHAARQRMEQAGVNARWQAQVAPFFAGLGDQRPDEGFRQITEIFHMD